MLALYLQTSQREMGSISACPQFLPRLLSSIYFGPCSMTMSLPGCTTQKNFTSFITMCPEKWCVSSCHSTDFSFLCMESILSMIFLNATMLQHSASFLYVYLCRSTVDLFSNRNVFQCLFYMTKKLCHFYS